MMDGLNTRRKLSRQLAGMCVFLVFFAGPSVRATTNATGAPPEDSTERVNPRSPAPSETTGVTDPAPFAQQTVAILQEKMPHWLAEQDVPGAAVAVVNPSGVLWEKAWGRTARGGDRAVTPRTLFSIQSMTKSFTALAVLLAVQDGLLDLDRPITDYLPDFTVHSRFEDHPERKMTLRLLLGHRAGFTHEAPVGGNFDSRPHSFAAHIRSISDTWLRYPVGYRFSYSNLGIDLAGYILEKQSGMPFVEYVRQRIFIPLGMTDSLIDPAAIRAAADRAVGHVAPDQNVPGGIPVDVPMIPAGGIYTNVRDMGHYLRFLLNGGRVNGRPLLRADLFGELTAVACPEPHERFGYGLGLLSLGAGPVRLLCHGGGGYGFISTLTVFPELQLGIVTLTNSNESPVSLPRIHGPLLDVIEQLYGPRPAAAAATPFFSTDRPLPGEDERLVRRMGLYTVNVRLTREEDGLNIIVNGTAYPIKFYDDDGAPAGLFGQYSEIRFAPDLAGRPGAIIHLNRLYGTIRYYDWQQPAGDADRPGPNRPEWAAWAGTYRAPLWGRLDTVSFTLGLDNGWLTVDGARCEEHRPGLFFTPDGEALDLRGTVPMYRNISLIRNPDCTLAATD